MARAQGNPRFVVGLLEALVDNGADLRHQRWMRIPEKLARWVRTEMARLDPPALGPRRAARRRRRPGRSR